MSLRWITLFADASICHETGAAGWACWAKTDGQASFTSGGILNILRPQSHEAELAALVNGVAKLREFGWLPAGIMLQSDNMRALRMIQGNMGAKDRRHANGSSVWMGGFTPTGFERVQVQILRPLVEGCPLTVRHIKGHSAGRGRNWVNRECDRLAKHYMQAKRAELRGEKSNKIA